MTRPNLRGVPGWFVRHRANIAATAQQATANLAGEIPYEGAITAELAQAVFGGEGTQHPEGGIAAVLQQATTALFGVQLPEGEVAATLQPALFAGVGAVPVEGGMAAELQAPTAAFSGGQVFAGTFTAQLRAATAALAGVVPVVYNATGAGDTASAIGGSTATATWSHTASGSSRAVVVAAAVSITDGTNFDVLTATYGGTSMTQLASEGFNDDPDTGVVLWGLLNPATGAQTVNVNVSATSTGAASVAASSVSYTGVSAFGATDAEFGTGTSRSQTVASATGERVVQAFGQGHITAMTSYNQTQRDDIYLDNAALDVGLLVGDAAGTGSNISYTASGPNAAWCGVAVRLQP